MNLFIERAMNKFDMTPLYTTLSGARTNFRQFDRNNEAMIHQGQKLKNKSYMNYMKYNHEMMSGMSVPDDCLSPEELRMRKATTRKLADRAKTKEKELAEKRAPIGKREKMPPIDYKALNSMYNSE
jgi:hypothetical protein